MMNKYYDKALKLFKRVKIVFIGSLDNEGYPNIKAVLVADKKKDLSEIIIKTNTSSKHVGQYKKSPKGCLYFYSIFGFKGCTIMGTFSVIETPEQKQKYWKKGDEKYYRNGEQDYCLLVFIPETGRYYHKYDSGDFKLAREG